MTAPADPYVLLPVPPDVQDYMRLRKLSGLSPFTRDAAEQGLAGTFFGVSVLRDGAVVGMGRIIGDGGCFFQIVDIAVLPEDQKQGLGKRIMSALMAHLHAHAPKSAYVSLIADVPANALYEQFGFRETAPRSVGMAASIR